VWRWGGSMAGGGLAIGVNGKPAGTIRYISTNALRYNTDRGVVARILPAV